MKIERFQSNNQILKELGRRIALQRLRQNLSQMNFARKIGISRSGLQRLENGDPGIRLVSLVGALRGLGAAHALDTILPEGTLTPLEMAKLLGKSSKTRKRASPRMKIRVAAKTWGDGTPMACPPVFSPEE